jgi:two-component sensor histidine kinase
MAYPMSSVAPSFRAPTPDVPSKRTLEAEADHRIGNNLALVAAMLRLQGNDMARRSAPVPVVEVRALLNETATRIESIGRLHRLLADAGDDALIDVGAYMREIANSIVASVAAPGAVLTSFNLAPTCMLRAAAVLPLGLIVGEVINNAIKYAHPSGLATAIVIACRNVGDRIGVEIIDDGVGLPEGFDPSSSGGLGFRLIRSLAEQIGATASFKNIPLGMRFTLLVPT